MSLTNIVANHTVSAIFSPIPSYTITASAGVGGTITPSGEITVIEGGSAAFEIAASSGYTILDVTVDGVSQGAVSTVSLTNVVANHTVSASFSPIPSYTITASAGVGGTITPSGEITVIEGGSASFEIAASSGYTILDVTVDGVSQGAVSTVSLTNVVANHTVSAIFSPIPSYTITAEAGPGGTISPSGEVRVIEGGSATFEVAALSGYRILDILVDGVSQGAVSTVTLTNVVANHLVAAYFEEIPSYTITAGAGVGGTISPSGEVRVIEGGSATFEVAALSGYRILDILVDGVSQGAVSTVTLTNVVANHLVAAYFEEIPSYTITAGAGVGGTISPSGEVRVIEGGSATFEVAALSGYRILDILVDGVSQGAVSTVTLTNVVANHLVAAYFEEIPSYTITAGAGVGGTISPSGEVLVIEGGSATFEVAALSGYRILDILVDGVSQGAVSTVTLTNVVANHLVAAYFEEIPSYTITAGAGVGGTISPSGEVLVIEGGSATFEVTPSEGFRILDVTVDGVSQGAVGTVTLADIVANHTVSAIFEPVPVGCTLDDALDLGGFGTETRNVPANACVKITQYPAWWNNTQIQFGTITGGQYPVPFSWTNGSATGTGTFTTEWQSLYLMGVSRSNPTLIQLEGEAGRTVGLRWY
ncbi:MAG: hypothetical protein H6686_12355 [Fibrobacteria bacterium]|nr:hypothetical protein [Fibrobacteria bacterium]